MASPERVRNCFLYYGPLRDPTVPNAHWLFRKARRLQFFTMFRMDLSKTTRKFMKNFEFFFFACLKFLNLSNHWRVD